MAKNNLTSPTSLETQSVWLAMPKSCYSAMSPQLTGKLSVKYSNEVTKLDLNLDKKNYVFRTKKNQKYIHYSIGRADKKEFL